MPKRKTRTKSKTYKNKLKSRVRTITQTKRGGWGGFPLHLSYLPKNKWYVSYLDILRFSVMKESFQNTQS
jgi:hypothetical protein